MKRYTGRERMRIAMSNRSADRVPTMPQICHGHAVNMFYDNYRNGIKEVLKEPEKTLKLVLKAAQYYDVDGMRLFIPGEKVDIVDDGKKMLAKDIRSGNIIGRVDVSGGGGIVPDKPPYLIEDEDDVNKIKNADCESLLKSESYQILRKYINIAHKNNKFFVASAPPGFTVNYLTALRGKEQALFDLIEKPGLTNKIMDKGLEIAIEHGKALVKIGVDALYIGDPLSSASVISPSIFEKFCYPRFKSFCNELKKYNILIYLHICGNSVPLIEMMADTGVDCIEPLDPLGGVEIEKVKEMVGRKVSLMGGVNTLTIVNGSPESVYMEALDCCNKAGKEGGYILAAGDMVPDLSPCENIKSMVKAANNFVYG
jgi:MtaA/CmuA family methyltransferase